MGVASTSSSKIVYCVLPGCKGQCANLAGQHQKKEQQNIPNPAGISDPIAIMYIPVYKNSVQIASVSPVDSSAVSKGIMCWVLLIMCWYILFTGIKSMVAKCCNWVSFLWSSRCCHMQKSNNEILTILRFAIPRELFTSKLEFWYVGGRWKCDDVALHAGSICNMWMGFSTLMNVVAFPEQITVMAFAGAQSAVVKIQIFGAIWDGVLMSEVCFICNEHLDVMLCEFLTYKAEMQVGGIASG